MTRPGCAFIDPSGEDAGVLAQKTAYKFRMSLDLTYFLLSMYPSEHSQVIWIEFDIYFVWISFFLLD